jgi:hypothetical protein
MHHRTAFKRIINTFRFENFPNSRMVNASLGINPCNVGCFPVAKYSQAFDILRVELSRNFSAYIFGNMSNLALIKMFSGLGHLRLPHYAQWGNPWQSQPGLYGRVVIPSWFLI